jgi:peptidoglycan-N-acetylmuramic acid deacetylase
MVVAALALGLLGVLALVLVAYGDTSVTPSPDPSPVASSDPLPSPVVEPSTPAPSPTEDPTPTTTTTPAPSPTPAAACSDDNTLRSWYYTPNDAHATPETPSDVRRLLRAYDGHYVGDTDEKVVYLTFDEGYENGFTARILDTLQAAGVEGAFFVTGTYVRNNPDLVRRMADEGHVVGNHTESHPSLPSLARDLAAFKRELTSVEKAYRAATGRELTRVMRPPMGEYSARSLCVTQRLGYATVFWSFAHRDWLVDDQPSVAVTLDRILTGSHKGAIYLLHPVSSSNTRALPQAIEGLKAQGYRFGSLTELL